MFKQLIKALEPLAQFLNDPQRMWRHFRREAARHYAGVWLGGVVIFWMWQAASAAFANLPGAAPKPIDWAGNGLPPFAFDVTAAVLLVFSYFSALPAAVMFGAAGLAALVGLSMATIWFFIYFLLALGFFGATRLFFERPGR